MSKTYTTVQGDRWDSVAYKQLGSCAYAPNLMAANPQHLGYFVFPAGIVLTLPDTETQTSSTLPPTKIPPAMPSVLWSLTVWTSPAASSPTCCR